MPEKIPEVAFVIVGWNNKQLLPECFESIYAQRGIRPRIYYVDNNSSDDSLEYIERRFPGVTLLPQNSNTGFAKGNNLGIAAALENPNVEQVALLNSDARIDPLWTKTILEFAKTKPRGACYQGTTLDYYNHEVIDSTHIFVARNGQGTQGNWRYYFERELGPRKVFGVNAAACMISRAFIEAQPFRTVFDETLYMYLEDVDLAARATVLGWDNYLVPEARAYHMGSASATVRSSTFSLYMTFRNNSAVIYKNFPFRVIFKLWPALVRGDIDTIRTLRRRGQKAAIWQVIKGRALGVLRLPLFMLKRRKMSARRHIDPDYLWTLMREGY